jgi:hypothetical protein
MENSMEVPQKNNNKLDMTDHSIWKAEAGGLGVQSQSGLHSKTLTQKSKGWDVSQW